MDNLSSTQAKSASKFMRKNLQLQVNKCAHVQNTDQQRKIESRPTFYSCPECHRFFSSTGMLSNHRRLAHRIQKTLTTKMCSNKDACNDACSSSQWTDGRVLVEKESKDNAGPSFSLPQHIGSSHVPLSILRLIQDCEDYKGKNSLDMETVTSYKLSPTSYSSTPTPPFSLLSDDLSSELKPPSPNKVSQQYAACLHVPEEDKNNVVQAGTIPPQPPVRNVTTGLARRNVNFNLPLGDNANGDTPHDLITAAGFPVPQTLRCPIMSCRLNFTTKGAFKNHLECHEGLKPFPCPVCNWAYQTEIQLLEHFCSKHSKEAVFKCGGCGKSYKTQRGCNNHKILKNCTTPRHHQPHPH